MSSRYAAARLAPLVIALATLAACRRDVAFTLTYQDARGLSAGSPVVHNAVQIGEVTSVDIDPASRTARLAVRIEGKFRDEAYREAAFSIVRSDLFGATTGKRSIMMEDRGDTKTPISNGDVIAGYEQTIDPTLKGITNAIDAARKAVDDSMKQRAEEKSPEGQ
jgi:ABC-type transporter Mla subunit MlaD